jgi:hypothetical protein
MKEFGLVAFLLVCFGIVGHYEWEDEQRVASLSAPAVTLRCVGRESPAQRVVQRGVRLVSHPVNTSGTQILECRVIEERT